VPPNWQKTTNKALADEVWGNGNISAAKRPKRMKRKTLPAFTGYRASKQMISDGNQRD